MARKAKPKPETAAPAETGPEFTLEERPGFWIARHDASRTQHRGTTSAQAQAALAAELSAREAAAAGPAQTREADDGEST